MAGITSEGTFSSSPLSTHPHSPAYDYLSSPQRAHLSITTQLSATSTRTFPDMLTFPKCAILSSNASTDTEASSDYGVDLFPGHSRRTQVVSPSPSLLTSMMQNNRQCHATTSAATSRSSSTSQPTPLTPTSSTCGKPILRRDLSAPTSASEDNGLGMKGLGLALTACGQPVEPPKRACSLKFAVRSPPSTQQPLSDSGYPRSTSSSKKSKFRTTRGFFPEVGEEEEETSRVGHAAHHHLAATLEQDEDEDEDEGYQEDSEGGFTSEEEEDYFTPARGRGQRSFQRWAQSTSFAPYSPGPRRRVTHSADQAVIYTSTNEDCPPPPVTRGPGRKVSIADMRMKFDHCSRHLSPPPRCLDLSPEHITNIAPAPPPASSPSARGLCRKRETSSSVAASGSRRTIDERSQPAFRPRPTRSAQSDDLKFQTDRCQSILKRDNSAGHRAVSPVMTFDRRSSVPAQCRLETRCANGAVSPVSSEAERESATQGLQRCLAKY